MARPTISIRSLPAKSGVRKRVWITLKPDTSPQPRAGLRLPTLETLARTSEIPRAGTPMLMAETTRLATSSSHFAWEQAGRAAPFAIVRVADNAIIGSTRFFDIERWSWPAGHPSHGSPEPDACEIGYTWLTQSAIRTAANTEAKLLMLTHAFETWRVVRVCLHTDVRNERSRAAMERMGGKFEGILRSHRMAADLIPRDSARYSIVAAEWPAVKQRLGGFLDGSSRAGG